VKHVVRSWVKITLLRNTAITTTTKSDFLFRTAWNLAKFHIHPTLKTLELRKSTYFEQDPELLESQAWSLSRDAPDVRLIGRCGYNIKEFGGNDYLMLILSFCQIASGKVRKRKLSLHLLCISYFWRHSNLKQNILSRISDQIQIRIQDKLH
jgi:hypothetical protein